MRTIRQIAPQKRNKNRYNISDEDGFLTSLSVETVLRYHLKEGMQVSDELLEEMKQEDTVKYAKEIGVAYVAYAPRTKRQLEQHLAKKGIDAHSIAQAVETLEKYSYLDDAAYVREFVRSYGEKLGAGAMRQKLMERGVSRQVIEENLQLSQEGQQAAALALAQKLQRKYADQPEQKRRQKMFAALARRGFSYDDIRAALGELGEEDELF
ncbi:MAG: RecX family transcriptional regulator [Clostridiales bacterium]|nr:RecX family transcriptional regulator [Clostridiales bacterium]